MFIGGLKVELSIKQLSFSYVENSDEKLILHNVDWKIDKPGVYTIQGDNGSGKTTFIKLLATILETKSGSIMLDGNLVGSNSYKKDMGYIPDTPILFDDLSGEEHIEIFCELWEMSSNERTSYRKSVYELAEKLNLSIYLQEKVRTYSLGTKYKLFYILVLGRKPKLLLLDEPFSSLDFKSQKMAKSLLIECAKFSIVIISSHQKEVIEELSQGKFLIKNKRVSEFEDAKEVIAK